MLVACRPFVGGLSSATIETHGDVLKPSLEPAVTVVDRIIKRSSIIAVEFIVPRKIAVLVARADAIVGIARAVDSQEGCEREPNL